MNIKQEFLKRVQELQGSSFLVISPFLIDVLDDTVNQIEGWANFAKSSKSEIMQETAKSWRANAEMLLKSKITHFKSKQLPPTSIRESMINSLKEVERCFMAN